MCDRKSRFLSFFFVLSFLSSIIAAADPYDPALIKEKGIISGKLLLKDGTPLSGGQVMFFNASAGPPPSPDKYQRIPESIGSIDNDGRFSVELQPGKYYFSAVRRSSGERTGKPRKGDYVCRGRDEKGQFRIYVLAAGQHLNLGTIAEVVPYKAESSAGAASPAIQGVIVDTGGNPVADVIVIAFMDLSRGSKPLFASEKTGKDGKYLLRLPAGTYYLRVKSVFASGRPKPGQLIGFYGETTPVPLTVKEGEIVQGVNLRAFPFPGSGPPREVQ